MMDDRLRAMHRHQIYNRLCELTDQLLELRLLWWDLDDELAVIDDGLCSTDEHIEPPSSCPPEDDLDF